ncbi:MAG TPA: hypothetical protein DCL32_12305 [Gammaproteobacteria bacterium]|jgi:uncharacterized alpha-E superfamily protein|nr:alpha-E domain-containing protein [Gammaproteobacteria bacterium]MDA0826696.1 alpha-E domain-containing protein [Pseudomonadota bacterium]MDA7590715.1 alpha-E domain-containing protein [Pseudomonadales bacterium]MBT5051672.1 alpha-E domain-containing protein [Gammaproteobacteria bacterium]MBT7389517.1 alpha-E domain-containing protein [Gammaproteobacteria bacterium]|tara:strand:- start:58 stop:975 length:918 start_codon:yes stop_codon:yes gene_type:complete
MLSRVAERLYWFGRYLERTENTARLISVYSNLVLDLPKVGFVWESLVNITGFDAQFKQRFSAASERNVVKFMFDDPACSLRACAGSARENSRTTRDLMPNEAWEKMNELHYLLKPDLSSRINRSGRHEFLSQIIDLCLELTGYLSGSMSRKEPYYFITLGRNVERADMTTRVIDVACLNLMGRQAEFDEQDNILWMGVLQSLNAYQMYRQQVQDRINGPEVVAFLLKDPAFPRSVNHCLAEVASSFKHLPRHQPALKAVNRAKRAIGRAVTEELLQTQGLHDFIDQAQADISTTHNKLSQTWFLS